jgi:hypothetical protein
MQTKEEKKEYNKQYRLKNKEKNKANFKNYYQKNKEKISVKAKERYDNNKELHNERSKTYRENNLESVKRQQKIWYNNNPDKVRENKLKKSYKISLIKYNEIFEKQMGCCAICGIHQNDLKHNLSVDHNHLTGNVRGLLCNKCNRGIGYLNDDIEILKKAVEYLIDIE